MISGRLKQIRDLILSSECQAILMTQSTDVRYFTGFLSHASVLVMTGNSIELFVPYVEYERTSGIGKLINCHCCPGHPLTDAFAFMSREDLQSIGFSSLDTTFATIKDSPLNTDNWIDLRWQLSSKRAVKQREEINHLADAAAITQQAIDAVLGRLKDGVREDYIKKQLTLELVQRSGELPAFETMVAFGKNSSCPHWVSTNRKLSPGDTIIIDCGARKNGYCADVTRTFFWKKASARQLRRYRIVLDSVMQTVSKCRTGETCRRLSEFVNDFYQAVGLSDYFAYSLGHGVGLDVHEFPTVSECSDDLLEENMIIAIEPGVYIPGWGGVRIEEMVWITSEGPQLLTRKAGSSPIIGA